MYHASQLSLAQNKSIISVSKKMLWIRISLCIRIRFWMVSKGLTWLMVLEDLTTPSKIWFDTGSDGVGRSSETIHCICMVWEDFSRPSKICVWCINWFAISMFQTPLITIRKRSCRKVMFLHLSVSHSVHRGCVSQHAFGADTPPPGRPPPGQKPYPS